MKKITILLMSITLLLLASCESKEEAARSVSHVDVLHEGHRYVVFYSNGGYGEAMCVLHSPECVCNKKGGEE